VQVERDVCKSAHAAEELGQTDAADDWHALVVRASRRPGPELSPVRPSQGPSRCR
jgi:hypothetical protein